MRGEFLYFLISSGVIYRFMTFFRAGKVLTLPQSVFSTTGFNLSCSNTPLNNFPSMVISKYLWGSTILYMTKGPTYLIATFLDAVLSWEVIGEIKYTKSLLLYWKYSLSLFIKATHLVRKFCNTFCK